MTALSCSPPPKLRTLVQALRAKGHPSLVEPLSVDPRSKAPSPHSDPSAAQVEPSIALRRRAGARLISTWRCSYLWTQLKLWASSTGSGLRRRDEATPCLSSLILSSPLSSRYPIQSSSAFIDV